MSHRSAIVTAALAAIILASRASGASPLIELNGTDLKGGAAELYGSAFSGESNVNYVYARPTGGHSTMQATFTLTALPQGEVFLYVKGRDDDGRGHSDVAMDLNGQALFAGPNEFDEKKWQIRKFAIPAGALRQGENTLTISCREPEGGVGMPPWFQVARCAIAGAEFEFGRDIMRNFRVILPDKIRAFPEPSAVGTKPGFPIRGIKGWMWKPEQYLSEIPVLAKYKMNFLMNCYGSMGDVEHYAWGNPEVNRWWEDLPDSKKLAYEKIVRECRKHGINYCFSMNPNLCSKRPLDYHSEKDLNDLYKHYAWMQSLGVKWFNISLDDISQGIDPDGQSRVVNEVYRRLKANDPEAKMIFCPTIYWGDGVSVESERRYLETVAKVLDRDVYLFWTGDSVVGNITRKAAESYKAVSGHKLFLWDNYPVNDAHPTMHLGPVVNRDKDLCEVVDGYMSNPLCPQNEGNRIPMLTCADYAYNPYDYDPSRSVGQAILHLETKPADRELLRELVEMYPGFIIFGRPSTGLNPVREHFARLIGTPHAHWIAEGYVRNLEDFAARMDRAFPGRYITERRTIHNDAAHLRALLHE